MSPRAEVAVAFACACALAACTRPDGEASAKPSATTGAGAIAVASDVASAKADADAPPAPREAWRAPACAAVEPAPYLEGAPRSGKSIGHTSVVFKLELSSGKKAAFKPASRRGPLRYKGEVAAYRLAQALGIPNVPVALPRTFTRAELEGALGGADTPAGKLLAEDVVVDGTNVHGALVPWIDRLEMIPVEADPLWSAWRAWVKKDHAFRPEEDRVLGKLAGLDPEGQRAIAAQASTLVAFDYLTGNWDRWSGANVGWDKDARALLYIDNDGAFFEKPPKDALAKNQRLLDGVDRFSRSFVARLRALDETRLPTAFGEEREGVPLLDAKVLASVAARRKALLSAVDAKIASAGAAETLAFP